MRVRLVFETEAEDVEQAVDILEMSLNMQDMEVKDIFKEAKVLRPFTRKEGVVYGRPKKNAGVQ